MFAFTGSTASWSIAPDLAGLALFDKMHASAAVDFKFDRDGGFFFIFNKKIGSDFAF